MRHVFIQRASILGLALLIAAAGSAQAGPILGGQIYTLGDSISVQILSGSAGHFSNIVLDNTPIPPGHLVGNNQNTIGHVEAISGLTVGQELVFRIDNTTSGFTYFMGPGARNGDGLMHATVDWDFQPGSALVEFEDLQNGGDMDYNDVRFLITGKLSPTPMPEPVSMAIWGLGAGGAFLVARRRRLAV